MSVNSAPASPAHGPAAGALSHPDSVLWAGETPPAALPVCDHYAGAEKFILKALALQAASASQGRARFDITADCEDGAPVGREAEHAAMIARHLASDANVFHRVGLRIHDPASRHWRQDLEIVVPAAAARLAYVVVPKLRSIDEIDQVIDRLDRLAPERKIPIHALIETHAALRSVDAMAAHPRVECLSFGLMDFVSAHHGAISPAALTSPGQFDHPLVRRAKIEIAAAAHAHGKVASHNVSTALREPDQVASDARRAAAEFGYSRMWSIHPGQIEAIVAALTPTHAEIERAADVIAAAIAAHWGPSVEDGTDSMQLHDRASYRLFWNQLQRAHAAGCALPASARRHFEETP
ncbi:MAG: aldolase/citrate lyase family protein [Burkholderiaceae bacterium]